MIPVKIKDFEMPTLNPDKHISEKKECVGTINLEKFSSFLCEFLVYFQWVRKNAKGKLKWECGNIASFENQFSSFLNPKFFLVRIRSGFHAESEKYLALD